MTRMRGAHVTVRSHALLPQPRSRKARRSGLVRDPYRSRLGVGAQRLQVKILARARKKRPPKTAPSGPRLAGNAVERVGPMTARGTRYRSSNPYSPRPQHSLTQTYPRLPNLAHTHPRPMRMRGRQPVATAGGAQVTGRRVKPGTPPVPIRGSPQRRRGTRRVDVIHRVLRVGQKPGREVARCRFF